MVTRPYSPARSVALSRRGGLRLLVGLAGSVAAPWVRAARPALPPDDSRLALVIGNADYRVRPLRNAVADARSVAGALQSLGYSLIVRENASQAGMIDAMKEFWLRGRRSDARVLYFSGHGLQYQGRNYLVPVDTVIEREDEVPRKAASVDELVQKLNESSAGVNVVILDACRTPPLAGGTRTRGVGGRTRSLAPGLAQVSAPQGTIIAFSTSPGAVAYDGVDETAPTRATWSSSCARRGNRSSSCSSACASVSPTKPTTSRCPGSRAA